jgi:redox-sensitive bicupin YhaK (pirin superfamily)
MRERSIQRLIAGSITRDGAGVRLRRIFGFGETEAFDPFLLFDAFGSDKPEDYMAGFPMHPHRGIETVTYMLSGRVRHGDSMGNSGVIGSGEMQWMTAGSGIIHEEMPERTKEPLRGFQLWVNLPRALKMCPPHYRDLRPAEIPVVTMEAVGSVSVMAGSFSGTTGPLADIAGSPTYLDITLQPGAHLELPVADGHTVFAWLCEGSLERAGSAPTTQKLREPLCILFGRAGDGIGFSAGPEGCRFLVATGRPLGEPVAWRGPIVMNTQAELDLAFRELQRGTFIK